MERVEAMPVMFIPDCPEIIIQNYQDMVYRIAFTHCRNTSDAQDITQEVFVYYLKKMPRLNGEEHLKAWLIRVTINITKSLLRSAWFKKTLPFSEQEASYDNDPAKTETYYAVISLPEKYRTVILLYYFEDYSVREVAHLLGRTETSVQTQLQRARAMLKVKLKEDWQND
jgi:RNA polymerase sigma-70 factor (ECF subfamily)